MKKDFISIADYSREEIEDMYPVEPGINTIYPARSLHKACGVPWYIIVDNHIGAVQVDTLRKHLGGYQYPVIVSGVLRPGIEVGRHHFSCGGTGGA